MLKESLFFWFHDIFLWVLDEYCIVKTYEDLSDHVLHVVSYRHVPLLLSKGAFYDVQIQ